MIAQQTKRYNQWHIGDTVRLSRTLTAENVLTFVELTGDTNPIHRNASSARYGQVLVPGVMLGSLATGIVGSQLPGPGCILLSQEFSYLLPVEVGDTVELLLSISALDEPRRQITVAVICESQQHEVMLSGTIIVKLRR